MFTRVFSFALLVLALGGAAHAQTTFQVPPGQLAPPVVVFPGSASQVLAVDGSAGAPSMSFALDPTTGFYRPALAGDINLVSSGARQILFFAGGIRLGSAVAFGWSSNADPNAAVTDTTITRVLPGEFAWTAVVFANLGAPANGTFTYCSDCTIASPCASGGTGALAKRLNGIWVCS